MKKSIYYIVMIFVSFFLSLACRKTSVSCSLATFDMNVSKKTMLPRKSDHCIILLNKIKNSNYIQKVTARHKVKYKNFVKKLNRSWAPTVNKGKTVVYIHNDFGDFNNSSLLLTQLRSDIADEINFSCAKAIMLNEDTESIRLALAIFDSLRVKEGFDIADMMQETTSNFKNKSLKDKLATVLNIFDKPGNIKTLEEIFQSNP